jgi:hypothetical protein
MTFELKIIFSPHFCQINEVMELAIGFGLNFNPAQAKVKQKYHPERLLDANVL